ncbi:6-phosphogluconolactonase [Thermostichus vulcanus]|uniref:6-phosphogluconolactonase n=1 Tax=Thermostichus vulcanus str. 'Rupite' TaxID=2813851 RepID=A0ABT0CBM8_THEVL|nr:6-phosphogluconolactonase [Thermostichus vulcanus]MCJ2543161.1 6-phosphogluconolactonase [Thermostichus vulcanus str. 'Rupite']
MQGFQLEIFPEGSAFIQRAIQIWQQLAATAIQERGRFMVALAGGSTPKKLYAALAETDGIPWQNIWLIWGDERYVPPDHPDSNYRMVRQALLERVGIPAEQVLPMPTQAGDPAQDASQYEAQLKQVFRQESSGDWPQLDLVLLGIGEDGHTASLFPGTEALQVQDRWVTVGQKDGEPRLTLTYPVLNQATQVVFLVTGANKAPILKEVLTTEAHLPCQGVNPRGRLLWLLDAAAAAQLPLQMALRKA